MSVTGIAPEREEALRMSANLDEKFHELDKRLDVGFAEMRGRLDSVLASRQGDIARIDDRIVGIDRTVEGLRGSVKAVHVRFDEFPRAEEVRDVVNLAVETSNRLDRLIYFMLGSGLLGGGLGAGLAAAFSAAGG